MKKMVFLLAVLLIFGAADAFAFSCGGKYITTGMQQYEVLDRCGEPSHVESWQENQYINPYQNPYFQNYAGAAIVVVPGTIVITYERWVYNFGPRQFMPVLTFRNTRLIKIEKGGYGY